MKRLWVVQAQFRNKRWDICDFTDFPSSSTDYDEAHAMKRIIQSPLYNYCDYWTERKFRVREYVQKSAGVKEE